MSITSDYLQLQLQNATNTFFGSEYLRTYAHATKTFQTNNYQYAPKQKFLFHVYFDINQDVYNVGLAQGANYGLAVKTIKLPAFTFNTNVLNQYNRKRIVQTKIQYDPIDISFHDDGGTAAGTPGAGGIIRQMWEHYYRYHFNDSTKPAVQLGSRTVNYATNSNGFNQRTAYSPTMGNDANWGFRGETNNASGVKTPFFKTINIFGFNQHNFVAYMLINPMITRFNHDTYSYADSNGTMENQMTIDYETVVYDSGSISGKNPGEIVLGFGSPANYDRTPSPITRPGSQNSILGQSGLIDGGLGVLDSLAKGNLLGAVQIAGRTYATGKTMDLSSVARQEVIIAATNAAGPPPNRTGIQIPLPFATPFSATPSPALNTPPTVI